MKKVVIAILFLAVLASAQQIPHGVVCSWTWTGKGTPTFSVYRSTVSGGEAKPALVTGLTAPTFTDTTALVNTQYWYTYSATVGGVESAPSSEVSALISVPPAPQSPQTAVF